MAEGPSRCGEEKPPRLSIHIPLPLLFKHLAGALSTGFTVYTPFLFAVCSLVPISSLFIFAPK